MVSARPLAALIAAVLAAAVPAQREISSPKAVLGHDIGEDHFLANYTQLTAYWRKVAQQSDRMVLEEIGTTSYGQAMLLAVISSPENLAQLERYRQNSQRLCLARDLDDAAARALAASSKSVIWIDAGMHATESVAAQNIIELVYRMNARTDPETLRILDDVILLVCPANPDGMEMIANAYMATREVGRIPVLYQRYIGHDNNRDFYMSSQAETRAINAALYRRWYPQVVYNHHQTAPRGTIIFTPPFRDPFNYNFDPLVVRGVELVSAHINARFAWEDKPGVISRTGAPYSTWWNGGLRTTSYFHNMIGILTESFGSPNPTDIDPALSRMLPSGDYPMPIGAQKWHARQTIEYLQTANYAILDLASRYREELLFNFYAMGRNSIDRGSRDNWTPTPRLLAEAERRAQDKREAVDAAGEETLAIETLAATADPALRDPRGYVLPADQRDFAAATRFVAALVAVGVEVHRATERFVVQGRDYPAGSWVVWTAQAFRPHVMDMFEPQWHPDDIGVNNEPVRPYDSAGWTPALSMGIEFDRIRDGFSAPAELVTEVSVLPGDVVPGTAGYLLDPADSNAYRALNRLLVAGEQVFWLESDWQGAGGSVPAGTLFVAADEATPGRVGVLAHQLGVDFAGVDATPDVAMAQVRAPRIGLYDPYGGDMETGWTQWVLEQFEFPVRLVHTPRIHRGDLGADFDVLLFHAGIPFPSGEGDRVQRALQRGRPSSVTAEQLAAMVAALPPFEDWSTAADKMVTMEADHVVPAVREFLEQGGTVLAFGSQAQALVQHFDLPIEIGTWKTGDDGERRRTRSSEFYVPTSLLETRVDTGHPMARGVGARLATVYRMRSPVFSVTTDDGSVEVVARYAGEGEEILASGWAVGGELLHDKAAVMTTRIGSGRLCLFGADVIFRGQPQASFKLVFNAILGE